MAGVHGGHWLAAAPATLRDKVVQKILNLFCKIQKDNQPGEINGQMLEHLRSGASQYEAAVFRQSDNVQDYLRTISKKMLFLQRKAAQAASHRQAHLNAVAANSSANSAWPPQVQSSMQIKNRPAQPPIAPVVQLPTAVTRIQTQSLASHDSSVIRCAQQPQMIRQDLRVNTRQSYQAHAGQQPNAATVQTGGQSNQQFQQPQTKLLRTNQQDLRVNQRQIQPQTQTNLAVNQWQSYQGHLGQQPNVTTMQNNQQDLRVNQRQSYQAQGAPQSHVAAMQIGHSGQQNNQQFGQHPVEVDWREDMFQKITSLRDAHFSELVEFHRALESRVPQRKTYQELESLPKEQADQYRKIVDIMGKIWGALRFLQLQKRDIPEGMKGQFEEKQGAIYRTVHLYRENKGRLSQNHREPPPRVASRPVQQQNVPCEAEAPAAINVTGGSDTFTSGQQEQNEHQAENSSNSTFLNCSQQKQNEHQAENSSDSTFLNCSQQQPAARPFTSGSGTCSQQKQQEHPTENSSNSTSLNCSQQKHAATPFTGESETCSQEKQQDHPADEAIPQLTQKVDPTGIPLGQQQTKCTHSVAQGEGEQVRAEAETPVTMEAAIKHGAGATKPLSLEALHSLAVDMGVNLKRAFPHTMISAGSMDDGDDDSCLWFDESGQESCYKRRKILNGALLDEIRAANAMLVETEIRITDDDAGEAEGAVVIEFCYIPVSLATELKAVINPSEMSAKLLVPADYPQSSPVLLGDSGERRKGIAAGVADKAFRRGLEQLLPEPRSIEGMARGWDECVRRSVVQFVHRLGGGTFSTRYGRWESCVGV